MTDSTARAILDAIWADGFHVSRITHLDGSSPAWTYTAWRSELGAVRPDDAETWRGRGGQPLRRSGGVSGSANMADPLSIFNKSFSSYGVSFFHINDLDYNSNNTADHNNTKC